MLISKSTLESMIKMSLRSDIKVNEGNYIVFRIFTEDKGPNFIIAKIKRDYYVYISEGYRPPELSRVYSRKLLKRIKIKFKMFPKFFH